MDLMENRLLMSRGVEKDLALAVTDFMGSFDVILDVFLDGKVWTEDAKSAPHG